MEADLGEIHAQALLVDDAHHHLLAVRGGQGRDPHVHAPSADLDHQPTVLRLALLGDVEVREHFDARDHGALRPLRQLLDLVQQAVDPEAHQEMFVLRLDVDVAGAFLTGAVEQPVGEPHDRPALGFANQLVDRLSPLVLAHRGDLDVVLGADDVVDHLVHRPIDVIVALDRLEDRRRHRQHGLDEHAAVEAQVFQRRDVEWIRHRQDHGRAAFDAHGQCHVLARQVFLDQREGLLVGGLLVEVHQRQAELLLQRLHQRGLGDDSEAHQRAAEQLAALALLGDRILEVLRRDDVGLDEHVAEPFVRLGHERS
jgi:hypothetical protein